MSKTKKEKLIISEPIKDFVVLMFALSLVSLVFLLYFGLLDLRYEVYGLLGLIFPFLLLFFGFGSFALLLGSWGALSKNSTNVFFFLPISMFPAFLLSISTMGYVYQKYGEFLLIVPFIFLFSITLAYFALYYKNKNKKRLAISIVLLIASIVALVNINNVIST